MSSGPLRLVAALLARSPARCVLLLANLYGGAEDVSEPVFPRVVRSPSVAVRSSCVVRLLVLTLLGPLLAAVGGDGVLCFLVRLVPVEFGVLGLFVPSFQVEVDGEGAFLPDV